ncbi:MAG: ABC transporter permease [Saprospiraceae bacterium]|nr:ABC transporter permease [Saprospiraceae bacterium]
MTALKLAWRNLTDRPLSMLLTLTLFALGVGLTSLLLLVNKQMTDKFEKNLAGVDIVVGAKGSPLQLILCNMYHVDVPTGNISLKSARAFLNPRHPLIKKSVPLSLGDSYKTYRVVGTLPDFVDLYKGQIAEGKLWDTPMQTTIGATVAAKTGLKIGDSFSSNHGLTTDGDEHDAAKFTVVGIFAPSGTVLDQLILTASESNWQVHDHHEETISESNISEAHNSEEKHTGKHKGEHAEEHEREHHAEPDRAAIKIDARTRLLTADSSKQITALLLQFKARNIQALNFQRNLNENTDMQAATPALEINRLFEMMGVGESALKALAGVIVVVSGLSIFIALFNSLRERRYELALLRVMGSGRERLFLLIVLEGLLLSFVGFIIGIVLSHGAMQVLGKYMSDAYRYTFSGKIWLAEEWVLLAGALAIGFVAAVIPALSAYKTDISKTLAKG